MHFICLCQLQSDAHSVRGFGGNENRWPVSGAQKRGTQHSSFRRKMAQSFTITFCNIHYTVFLFYKSMDEKLFPIQIKHLTDMNRRAQIKSGHTAYPTPIHAFRNWAFNSYSRFRKYGAICRWKITFSRSSG
jgi:hypothetical protein